MEIKQNYHNRQTDTLADGHRQTDRQTDTLTDGHRQTDRQTDRHTRTQMDIDRHRHTSYQKAPAYEVNKTK